MFVYNELDGFTRKFMRQEFMLDKEQDVLYQSRVMTEEGLQAFPNIMLDAINHGDIDSFAQALNASNFWGPTARENSHLSLAEEQFNQYYMRGLLKKLIDEGVFEAEVYLACEESSKRRRGAQPGDIVNCEEALEDLRDANRSQFFGRTGLVRCGKYGLSIKRATVNAK